MKLKNFLIELYMLFSTKLSSNHKEDIKMLNLIDEKEIILKWRKTVFMIIFASFLVFISVPYFMSVRFVIQHKMWVSFTVYTLSYLSVVIIVFFRQIPFKTRVAIGLFAFYSLGVVAFVYAVAGGSGKLYLLSSSIVATLLLGIKFGIFSIFINALTLLVVGYFVATGAIAWIDGNPVAMKAYILTGATFIFLNSVITISLGALVRALENNLIESQNAAYELKKSNEELLQNQKKREKLETQLIQAQKMESIGRLAGGVAHDYNNISSIIIGYSEFALEKVKKDEELYDDLTEIYSAAKRSADITRQLLAFARQQTVSPKVLNLNDTIEKMLKMLERLIGEDVDLAWFPGADSGQVRIDPSQVDQILANLCVNARDAITDVGKITIETENVRFDQAYCDDHAEFVEGEFVMLAVSDDGCGISSENLNKLFDPFFTTKGLGKGTGLGLATVYGIVKQNNGFINVYSFFFTFIRW
jgi:signal transduction histidine kinase